MKNHRTKKISKKKRKAFASKFKDDHHSSDSGSDIDRSAFYRDDLDDIQNDKKLTIGDGSLPHERYEILEQEEVLPITDDEVDNNPAYSDSETEKNLEDDLPNLEAWGKDKSIYYNADFVDNDRRRKYRIEDEEIAKEEEKGALEMQKNLASIITAENFHSIFSKFDSPVESSDEDEQKEVSIDWSAATEAEKLKLLRKTSPEFLIFVDEFKEKLTEVKDRILPLLEFAKQGKIASDKCENYLKLKYQLLMHYCMNISFYMVLKSQGTLLSNHPVLERIFTYKKLLNQLEPTDNKLKPEIDIFFEKLKNQERIRLVTESQSEEEEDIADGDSTENVPAVEALAAKPSKKKKVSFDTATEKEIFSLYSDMKARQKKQELEAGGNKETVKDKEMTSADKEGADDQDKRKITYEIMKNKGKQAARKKEMRNPRIRLKNKYNRAVKKRKSQVKGVVRELKRYDGESTGISSYVVRSTKFK